MKNKSERAFFKDEKCCICGKFCSVGKSHHLRLIHGKSGEILIEKHQNSKGDYYFKFALPESNPLPLGVK